MKTLFTLLSIDCGNKLYLQSAARLVTELLAQTRHDVLLSTNNTDFFNNIKSERLIVRNNIDELSIFKYGSEFNYNLKYHAFQDISPDYDIIIYLDCDVKLDKWTEKSDEFINRTFDEFDFGATRLNCSLIGSVDEYLKTGKTLFSHKINSFKILEKYNNDDDIMFSLLPSEHFLIFRNDSEKIKNFYLKWKELNDYLQDINGEGGSWGDGFEIGISARYSKYHKAIEISQGIWDSVLGFKFNGNKYYDSTYANEVKTKRQKSLTDLANDFGSDKGTLHFERHSYTEIYQNILTPYINKHIKMLEIGVNDERFPGASVKMWTSFFSDVDFIGFDIDELSKEFENGGVKIFIGSQGNESDLNNLINTHGGGFDVIIDDGSHQHIHHILTFSILEPHLNQGGLYIIEDLHAYDGQLTKNWLTEKNKKFKLFCDGKLLVYEK